LQGLANTYLYPSEPIDKVWCIHMAHGKNYIDFCMKVCTRVFYHGVFTGNTSGGEDQSIYNMTLIFYQQIYLIPPPSMIWPPAAVRFDVNNFRHTNINLIRVSGLWTRMQQGLI